MRVTACSDPLEQLIAGDNLLEELLRRPAWQADGLCREHPEVDFFPGPGEPHAPARAVCADCLVQTECRSYALAQPDDLAGIWGGTGQRDRRRIRAGHPEPISPTHVAVSAPCTGCGRLVTGKGYDRLTRDGLCHTCYERQRKQRRAATKQPTVDVATCALCHLDVLTPRRLDDRPYHGHCYKAELRRRRNAA